MVMAKIAGFKFRRYDTIGDPSAESDERFLLTCFIDTGALSILSALDDPRGIALGRTGAGKTALVKRLASKQARVKELDPHDIALGYISNSSVLRFFEGAGVNLDPFYRFLWRHLLVVETIKMRFELTNEEQKPGWWDSAIMNVLRKRAHKEAFEYLGSWGTNFIENTGRQVRDVTLRIENNLQASAGMDIADVLKLGAEGAKTLSEEQRYSVRQRGQDVLNRIQVNKLTTLFRALDEDLLVDKQKKYYIVLDRLDENWVDDETRYRLLRTLIEVMRDYNSKVEMGKVIISLRTDLFDRILQATTDSGFQGEKYRSLCLPVTWDHRALTRLIDQRINELVKSRWTGRLVTHSDVLVGTVGKKKEQPIEYMVDRTLMRPQDIITFFNICVTVADSEPVIHPRLISKIESTYSQQRLDSLADEWSTEYPLLGELWTLLKARPMSFSLKDITTHQLEDVCLKNAEHLALPETEDAVVLEKFFRSEISDSLLRVSLVQILYRVGVLGLKPETYSQISWSYDGSPELTFNQITDDSKVYIHKMLWRALGTLAA